MKGKTAGREDKFLRASEELPDNSVPSGAVTWG